MAYDRQIWVVPSLESKIAKILVMNKTAYTNIELLELREVQTEPSAMQTNEKC